MIEWKRIKPGEYESEDKRFYIVKNIVKLYNAWELLYGDAVYYSPTLSACKRKAESIVKNEKKNGLQIQCWLYFKTKETNIDDAMKEVYKVLNQVGIEMGENAHVVLRDNEDGVIYERDWDL